MNVRICTFPEGQDPDSFARDNSLDELKEYLDENARDFINFKASLLASEAKNDPINRAETIRDMVVSISKIPDAIKQEVYIKECARIMDISEEVLFNTLAQILQKVKRDTGRKTQQPHLENMGIVATDSKQLPKVDVQYELELKIIELLLLYGTEDEEFEDLILETTEEGKIAFTPEKIRTKVYEKIYLDLQDDEIEFTNEEFRALYYEIINRLNEERDIKIDILVNQLPPDKAEIVTNILMEDEKHSLHNWEGKDIFVKEKKDTISQVVNETVLNLRRHLVSTKISELANSPVVNGEYEDRSVMENIEDYKKLKEVLSTKLRRVL